MIHIVKAKGGYMAITLGKKREVLATTEVFKSKQAALENVYSQSYWFPVYKSIVEETAIQLERTTGVMVQDDTLTEIKFYYLYKLGSKLKKLELSQMIINKLLKIKSKKYEPKKSK
jgi:hypothetical protein